MKVYRKSWQQILHADLDEVWAFFSKPENLNSITPPDMHFEIMSEVAGQEMYEGMIIQYKVSPFPYFTSGWVTEITQAKLHEYFIDEQRFGPFAFWHHQHHFHQQEAGVWMTDILHYAIPYGIIGKLANAMVVNRRIDDIFAFRKKVIAERFGPK